jgi:hypothetical protein
VLLCLVFSVIMPNAIMPSVVRPSVAAPRELGVQLLLTFVHRVKNFHARRREGRPGVDTLDPPVPRKLRVSFHSYLLRSVCT